MLKIDEKGKEKYPYLFSPIKIGNITVPNRIFFPPWCFNWAKEDGSVSKKLHDYYVSLAKNGCGIIYTGAAAVSWDSLGYQFGMKMNEKKHVESNKKLCKEIEACNAIPGIQLVNSGRQSITAFTGQPLMAPSDIPCRVSSQLDPGYKIKVMTLEDIRRVKNDFVNGAILAAEAGYKIIQLHAAHGYLLTSFLSPYTNKRTDEYGGSIENRCRFLVEIIEAIRKELKNSIAIDVRITVDELVEGGLKPEDFAVITPLIEKAGVDMMNASICNLESGVTYFGGKLDPEARYVYTAETLKKYTSLPIGHAFFIGSLEKGEELVSTGKTDLVGYGRMQFADQGFIKKSVMGGKISNCIWCGRCLGDLMDPQQHFFVHCSVNQKYRRSHVNKRVS